METKKCKTCGVDKEIIEFPIHSKKLNTRMAHCILCYKLKRRNWRIEKLDDYRLLNRKSYAKHSEKRKIEVIEYQKINKDKIKVWSKTNRIKRQNKWLEWKSTLKCSVCGENHPSCLEFHHIDPTKKSYTIRDIKYSKIKLDVELKKCIVLCTNCHRKFHNNYINIK